jgi:RES domain
MPLEVVDKLAFRRAFEHIGTHRLIPAKYSNGSVLETLPLPAQTITDLTELDAATNERKLAEHRGTAGIGPGELLYGVPEAHIVNAAFCHPGPHGGRFNDSTRGAWYAGGELETSIAEAAFHRRRFLEEGRITGELTFEYVDFLADFHGEFHHLDEREVQTCRRPVPVPQCYGPSQALAIRLLYGGSPGIIYQSVRHPEGTSVACFRPALVVHPRRDLGYRITLEAATDTYHVEPITMRP